MIALTLSALVMTVFIALYVASIKQYTKTLNTARLDQSLQASLRMMANDIRRAGFWGNAISDLSTNTNTNPFNTNDISINGAGNCILLSYDQNGDGLLPAVGAGTDDERYGYRLSNNAIQARPNGASYLCTAAANVWENITDPNSVQITALSFVKTDRMVTVVSPATMTVRNVVISVTGRLTADNTVTKTLSENVKIRNDKYTP